LKELNMKVDVYDTYTKSIKGHTMHFDVLVPEGISPETAFKYAQEWLEKNGEDDKSLRQELCNFCHSELARSNVEHDIKSSGYHILQMQGCPNPA
jgi:hypothetical protein